MTDDRSTQASVAVKASMVAFTCSSILVPSRHPAAVPPTVCTLPGYDAADIRVLDWIVAHRRQPRGLKALAKLAA
jgi:hypothetical protein